MIHFTQIPDRLKYIPVLKSRLSEIHSDIIMYVSSNFTGKMSDKRKIIDLMNTISYKVISNDDLKLPLDVKYCLENFEPIPDSVCRGTLKSMYISLKDVIWDIDVNYNLLESYNNKNEENLVDDNKNQIEDVKSSYSYVLNETKRGDINKSTENVYNELTLHKTDKSDLYIQPPNVPLFDFNSPVLNEYLDGNQYVVYKSLPLIPTKQNEISATTDVNMMSVQDLRRLFPNTYIQTRSPIMYQRLNGIDYDDNLGIIIPVDGFSKEQVIDNIIKYPHLYKLNKMNGDEIINFYSTIEIDGELLNVGDVWYDLPESEIMPYNIEYIKEYVVRRYLLERDVLGYNHKYKMFGELNPYLTLFMPIDFYIQYGHTDIDDIGRRCVESRISYKRSRNPIFRTVNKDV